MNKVSINTLSNIVAKLWGMVSIYIFVPFYIAILGESAYGLVSFFTTLQATLQILGLGLSNSLRREFAVGDNTQDNAKRKYKLMRSIELIYFVIGALIICMCAFGSGFIAEYWLNIENLDPILVSKVIALMGISIALQLISNLYSGCLFGLDMQVSANFMHIAWSASKSIGALLVIYFVSPNLLLFYSWHIVTDAVYFIMLRIYTVSSLKIEDKERWHFKDFSCISSIWVYTCGILLISFISLVNRESNKVIISKFLTLTELGAYNVGITLGSLTAIIPSALYTTFFQRFTNRATTNSGEEMKKDFLQIDKLCNLIVAVSGAFVAIYSLPLIGIWTGSDAYVNILGIWGAIIVLGVAMVEFQEIPYALALANGDTKYNVYTGVAFLLPVILSTYFSIKFFGLGGAAVTYLVMMIGQTVVYKFMVYKAYITRNPIPLMLKYTVAPTVISLLAAVVSKYVISFFSVGIWLESIYAVLCGAATLIVIFVIFAKKDIKQLKSIFAGKSNSKTENN